MEVLSKAIYNPWSLAIVFHARGVVESNEEGDITNKGDTQTMQDRTIFQLKAV